MNNFNNIKAMDIDGFAEWLDNLVYDDSPWLNWFNEKYCHNCEPVIGEENWLGKPMEFSWCEINKRCKYFQDMDDIPSCVEMAKMWLESEV